MTENKLLVLYIRALLQNIDFSFNATRNAIEINSILLTRENGWPRVDKALAAAINAYLSENEQVHEIKGYISQTMMAKIDSANIYFFDKDGERVGLPVWQEFRLGNVTLDEASLIAIES